MKNKSIESFFEGKPETYKIFEFVLAQIHTLGPSTTTIASQISISVKRKFAWFWLYNVTQSNPNGILHLMLAIDKKIEDPHVRNISQISKNRWNHQIVIRTLEDAKSQWLQKLITSSYQYGSK